jgi:acetyl-CoA acyltransferase
LIWEIPVITRISKQAYDLAGIGPKDVRVMQCHDAFTSGEVFAIEECGICPNGEGARFVWEGKADINGKVPVNSDGGLIGRGHPVGATGLAQTGEIVRQMRGQAGPRQINPIPKVGLHHNVGVGGANVFVYKV